MRNLPHHAFEHNQIWLELSLIAQDLLSWTKLICLDGELAKAEPKRLRHRLLHTAGRLVRHGRRTRLRLQNDWPWADALAAAFTRLRAIPSALLSSGRPMAATRDDQQAGTPLPACPKPAPAAATDPFSRRPITDTSTRPSRHPTPPPTRGHTTFTLAAITADRG